MKQHKVKDDLKISKVEYLSNLLLDHTQILNLDLGDKGFKNFKLRQHHMEDNLKISKVEFLSIHLLDLTQILNLNFDYQNRNDLKISKGEYISNHPMDRDLWVLGGNLEENSEKN